MLLDWMDSCSCMVLWPPRAHRAQLYTCYIGWRERLKGQMHAACKKQSATVYESNIRDLERRSGRQRETEKPDIALFNDHQKQTASMERWNLPREHCSFESPKWDATCYEHVKLEEMQSCPNKNLGSRHSYVFCNNKPSSFSLFQLW